MAFKSVSIIVAMVMISSVAEGQRIKNILKADSIVSYFYGNENFKKYVKFDWSSKTYKDGTTLYKYRFRHPKFPKGETNIAFTLDSDGLFVEGKEVKGLIRLTPTDESWLSGGQALELINKERHREIKYKTFKLLWDTTYLSFDVYKKTHDYRDIQPGNLYWQVEALVEFRNEMYMGKFCVDAITGGVARRFAIPWD